MREKLRINGLMVDLMMTTHVRKVHRPDNWNLVGGVREIINYRSRNCNSGVNTIVVGHNMIKVK